jgi:hypothetical protein
MANHSSPRATKLYDRRSDEIETLSQKLNLILPTNVLRIHLDGLFANHRMKSDRWLAAPLGTSCEARPVVR